VWLPALVLCLPALVVATIGLTRAIPQASADPLVPAVSGAEEIVVAAAGDIAKCTHDNDEATARVLDSISPTAVLALGDNAYPSGTDAEFTGCYEPTWGRHKAKTFPAPGNHDYQTAGAAGYFNYFGAAAGDPTKGYYAFDLGAWRFYALNSNCGAVSCAAGSAQEQWLRADLAANPRTCTAAFMHHPRFASGHTSGRRNNPSMAALFQAFYDASGDLWLVGHNHQYERLTRLAPSGAIDLQRGVRLFVAGTGGAALYAFGEPITGSEVRNNVTHGVLKLTLRDDGYDWAFVPIAGGSTFTDGGTDICGAATNPGNAAPIVNAGPDQAITPAASATLDGTVTDDGQPSPGTLTTTWSQISGQPGTVTFGDPGSVNTTASFSQAGTYVLRLTADDGALSSFDELTVTVTDAGSGLYFSLRAAGTVGGVSAANEDIVFFDASTSLAFDGSDVGLGSLRIDAFSWVDADTLLLSFDEPGSVGGAGAVDDSDIVRFEATSLGTFTAGSFFLYLDGSDVGLTTDAEDVDAVELLAGGQILVSSTGAVGVSGVSAADEDLVAFTPTSLGTNTAGSFSLYFDGSDVGLGDSGEDVDAAALDPSTNILLSTTNVFAVPGVSGADEDVFVFTPTATGSSTAGSYASTLHFDGSSLGLAGNDVFAIDV
jgi:hypothetical protein